MTTNLILWMIVNHIVEQKPGNKYVFCLLQALTLPANPEVYQEFQGAGDYVDAEEREEAAVYDAIDEAEANEGIPTELQSNSTSTSEAFYFPQVKSALPELCTLPEDRGTCFGEQLSWRFDSEARSCVTFMYSGCKHNANYFTSEETCERACGKYRSTDVCRQPKEAGQCHQKVSRWHFNEEMNECQMFFWSGCGGNGNRFSSKAECQHLCSHEIKVKPEEKDACALERDVGPCTDALTQWYFDKNDKDCRIFTYGGCRGNDNRFNSKDECTQKCQPKLQELKLHHTDICKLPFAVGHCDGNEIKWFFDSSDEQCRTFSYTGCSGNENRFDSEEECVNSWKVKIYKRGGFFDPVSRPHRRAITITETEILPPKLRFVNPGPYIAGTTVELRCIVETNTTEFGWFKNNTQIDEISVNQRFIFNDKKDSLTIKNIQKEDSGKYSCAAGAIGILSQQEDIIVKDPPPKEFCLDKGTPTTCELIRKTGLCSNVRYGKFCCQTCTKIGYKL
uniref:Papilin n=1 Tax=Panagrolaimus davidi TaxID=227884 RepID=A0A914PIH8_9BILA